MKFVLSLITIQLSIATIGCFNPFLKNSQEDKDRISQLEKSHAEEFERRRSLEKQSKELGDHQQRILNCHRDFRGSMGLELTREVHLVKETQRTQRFNCQNEITSDQTEDIQSARSTIILEELKNLDLKGTEISVINRQTCQGGGFSKGWTLFGKATPSLTVNRSNTLLDHEVFEGINFIDFAACKSQSPGVSKDCTQPTWIATLVLTVKYTETHNNEIRIVKPDPATCQK